MAAGRKGQVCKESDAHVFIHSDVLHPGRTLRAGLPQQRQEHPHQQHHPLPGASVRSPNRAATRSAVRSTGAANTTAMNKGP